MNITIIMANPAMTGGDRVCAIYAKKLTERGHHVNVVAPQKKLLTFKQQLKRLIKGDGWIKVAEQLHNHFDLLDVNVTYLESNRPVTGSDVPDADVVIATWWETAEWVAHFPACKGAKVYFIQHYEVHEGQPIERVKQTYLLPLYKITISNWLVQTMRNTYQDPRVSLVPNSVDSDLFFAAPRKKQIRPTLGFLYSKVEFKGIDTLLKVIEQVKERLPELRVICFGSIKPLKNLLPKYFEFEYQPQQSRLREIYGQCDIWLCCSRSEGFHLPPLEAMACRCPVVSTKVGGPEDIIRQGENGFLCEIDDVERLTDTVMGVLNSTEQQWLALSDEAYATAIQYSWDHATELFEQGLILAVNERQSIQL
ncbi:glycosyltransferase family 4 protein [Methylobacter sp. sgz302048]|uniref:glycosyltransferase family 4 protein n=1 Tax=Methylobacter sp. sgz302048 TaxID=3455945 RepID=UPI003FA0AA52